MRPAAFLFDLDGTLVDTEAAWAEAMVGWLASKGARTTFTELLPRIVGRSWLDIDAFLHAEHPELGGSSPDEDAAALREFYARRAPDPRAQRIEGSIAFFRRAARVAPCAIVSGSPREDVLAAAAVCGLGDCVSLVLGAGDYARGKPDPSGYLAAAARLGVRPCDCVVVEDSAAGVASGVAAGMKVIALDRGRVPQSFSGEAWRVGDLAEFDFEGEFQA